MLLNKSNAKNILAFIYSYLLFLYDSRTLNKMTCPFLLTLMLSIDTFLGVAVMWAFFRQYLLTDCLAVGSGFAYYSLSSVFITEMRGAELGTVALLSNIFREILALLVIPPMARTLNPLAAVSMGGATTFDTSLPVIMQSAGKDFLVVAAFHGLTLDFSVPLFVTLFCNIGG